MKDKDKEKARRDGLLKTACDYLYSNGYAVRGVVNGNRDDFLGECFFGSSPSDMTIIAKTPATGLIVGIAVMDGDKRASIPLQGLGESKAARARADRLNAFTRSWMRIHCPSEPPLCRFDALWVASNCLSHIVNIKA